MYHRKGFCMILCVVTCWHKRIVRNWTVFVWLCASNWIFAYVNGFDDIDIGCSTMQPTENTKNIGIKIGTQLNRWRAETTFSVAFIWQRFDRVLWLELVNSIVCTRCHVFVFGIHQNMRKMCGSSWSVYDLLDWCFVFTILTKSTYSIRLAIRQSVSSPTNLTTSCCATFKRRYATGILKQKCNAAAAHPQQLQRASQQTHSHTQTPTSHTVRSTRTPLVEWEQIIPYTVVRNSARLSAHNKYIQKTPSTYDWYSSDLTHDARKTGTD